MILRAGLPFASTQRVRFPRQRTPSFEPSTNANAESTCSRWHLTRNKTVRAEPVFPMVLSLPKEAGATLGVGTSTSSVRTGFFANACPSHGVGLLTRNKTVRAEPVFPMVLSLPKEAGATLGVGTSTSSVRTGFSANAGRRQGPGMLSRNSLKEVEVHDFAL